MDNRRSSFNTLIITFGTIIAIITVGIYNLGMNIVFDQGNSALKLAFTNLQSKSADLATTKAAIIDAFNTMDFQAYIVTAITWLIFIIISYALIITLTKLRLKDTNPLTTYYNSIKQTVTSKQIFNTFKYFILSGLAICAILLVSRLMLPVQETLTISTTSESSLATFLATTLNGIYPLIAGSIAIFILTIILFFSVSSFFKIEYKQKMNSNTIIKRAFKATLTIALIYVLIYLIAYIPLTVLSNSGDEVAVSLYKIIIFVVSFAHYITILIVLPQRFTGKMKEKQTPAPAPAKVESEPLVDSSDIVIPNSSRSRLTGFTKNHEIRGSRIERSRRPRRGNR